MHSQVSVREPRCPIGLLVDLQDTALLVEGIDRDIVSDIAINIIREPPIGYTQRVCEVNGLDTEAVDSGPLWQPHLGQWITKFETLPMGPDGRLLLIPKTPDPAKPSPPLPRARIWGPLDL